MAASGSLSLNICTCAVLQPVVPDVLLDKLRDSFPAEPSRSMTHRELDHLIGQQEVVRYIAQLHREQSIVGFEED